MQEALCDEGHLDNHILLTSKHVELDSVVVSMVTEQLTNSTVPSLGTRLIWEVPDARVMALKLRSHDGLLSEPIRQLHVTDVCQTLAAGVTASATIWQM